MVRSHDRLGVRHEPAAKAGSATGRAALMAALLAQMRQPHEMTRLSLLLLVMASLRLRGYTIAEPDQPVRPGPAKPSAQRRKGFHVKRPRTRFL